MLDSIPFVSILSIINLALIAIVGLGLLHLHYLINKVVASVTRTRTVNKALSCAVQELSEAQPYPPGTTK